MANMTFFDNFTLGTNGSDLLLANDTFLSVFSPITWGSVFISAIGTVANALTIIVILSSQLKTSVFMNVLVVLAIADNLRLWSVLCTREGIFGLFDVGDSLTLCRFFIFIQYTFNTMSSWLVILISLERFIALYYVFKVHIWCTMKRIYTGMLVIFLISSLTSVYYFDACTVKLGGIGKPVCVDRGTNPPINRVRLYMSVLLYIIIPFCIITILNTFITVKIMKQKKFRAKSSSNITTQSSSQGKALIAMMIGTSVVFAVTCFPKIIFMIAGSGCRQQRSTFCAIFAPLTMVLDDLNHSVNFFIYCLSGTVFRRTLIQLFRRKRKADAENNASTAVSVSENVL